MTSERYRRLHERYFRDGEELLRVEDLPQASEKFWGAVAQMIKAVAATRQLRHASHQGLREVMRVLYQETQDEDLLTLMRSAERLHVNFYENDLDRDTVVTLASDVRTLLQKLLPFSGELT